MSDCLDGLFLKNDCRNKLLAIFVMMSDYYELSNIKQQKGLSNINIRSILHKFDIFRHDLDNTFGIVGVSETWLKSSLPDALISTKYYNLFRKDRNHAFKRGGGLCLYVKDGLSSERIILTENRDVNKDLEWLCTKAIIGGHKKQIILLVYRPPSGNTKNAIDCLRSFLEYLSDNF